MTNDTKRILFDHRGLMCRYDKLQSRSARAKLERCGSYLPNSDDPGRQLSIERVDQIFFTQRLAAAPITPIVIILAPVSPPFVATRNAFGVETLLANTLR